MTRTNLQILREEFSESIPLTILVEMSPDQVVGQAIVSRDLPVDGTNRPQALVLFRGHYSFLPTVIAAILDDPFMAYIAAGWNPDGVKIVEEEEKPDLNKFAGKKLRDIGLGDL